MQPVLEEVFFGGPSGSWLIKPERRDRLRSRPCKSLAEAVLASTHPDMFTGERATAFRSLRARCLLTRFGGDCYNYAMLAAGYLDLVVESQLKPYDIVPLSADSRRCRLHRHGLARPAAARRRRRRGRRQPRAAPRRARRCCAPEPTPVNRFVARPLAPGVGSGEVVNAV